MLELKNITTQEKGALQKLIELIVSGEASGTQAWTCFSSPKTLQTFKPGKPDEKKLTFHTDDVKLFKSAKKRLIMHLLHKYKRTCAYCRRPIGHYAYSWHIEHIYCKSLYPELAFSLSNLTIGCIECNSWKAKSVDTKKHINFPIINPASDGFNYSEHLNYFQICTEDIHFVKYKTRGGLGQNTYDMLKFKEIERSAIIDSLNPDIAALHYGINAILADQMISESGNIELVQLLTDLRSSIYSADEADARAYTTVDEDAE